MHSIRLGITHATRFRGVQRALSTRTAASLLQEGDVVSALQKYGLAVDDVVNDKAARIALLDAFVKTCQRPVPSNALGGMRSAADMADFFERATAPLDVQPHAKRMFETRVETDGAAALSHLDTTTDNVREKFKDGLPSNLKIDPATFEPRPFPVMQTRRRPLGLPYLSKKTTAEARREKKGNKQFTEEGN